MNYDQGRGSVALYELNVAAIDDQWDAVTEPKVNTHGMEGYRPRKIVTLIREDGIIRAPKGRVDILMDAVTALNKAFDAVNAFAADSSTINQGYLPLAFSIPTADLANYPTGLITAEYFVRALKRPVARTSQFEGDTCRFSLYLQAIDPRCYYTVAQTATRTDAGTVPVDNSLAGFPSWPIVAFTVDGNGSQKISIGHNGAGGSDPLIIDMTGLVSPNLVVVNMERRTITVDGSLDMDMYVSGSWIEQPAASVTWTIANVTGTLDAAVEIAWSRAL